jgi:hypothetical protein
MFNIFNALGFFNKGKTPNMNIMTANDYYDRLKLIALSIFEWEGLPESCNAKFLEETLYLYGRALFINEPTMGYLNTRCTPSGNLNVYNEPVSFNAYGVNLSQDFDRDECVLIRNNYLERPTDNSIILFASRLTDTERTIDVNINAQKTPVIVYVEEKDRLTIKNIYKQYEGNEPFILAGKGLSGGDLIKVMKTDAPFVADKLQINKQQIWNEALTFLGINNANTDKRERLITDEVEANNEVISINADSMLLTRQEACKQINKMFNLNVSVKMRSFDKEETEYKEPEKEDEE